MKTRILTQLFLSGGLLTALVACSDSTQFAEKTMAAAADATKPVDGATTTNPDGTVAANDPSADSKSPIDPATGEPVAGSPDASNPSTGGTSVSGSKSPSGSTTAGGTSTSGGTTASNGGTSTSGGSSTSGGTSTSGGSTASNGGNTSGGSTSNGGSTSTGNTGSFAATCSDHPDMPIVAQLYQLPENTQKLPDFTGMNPIGDVCVNQLTIADRDFTQGFPGVSDIFEWFALDMRFKLNITTPGTYTFYANSDDGSILYIDGKMVVNNDGNHQQTEKSGSVYLGAGVHDVEMKYYQGPRYRIALELFWTTPGSSQKVYVPKSAMLRP